MKYLYTIASIFLISSMVTSCTITNTEEAEIENQETQSVVSTEIPEIEYEAQEVIEWEDSLGDAAPLDPTDAEVPEISDTSSEDDTTAKEVIVTWEDDTKNTDAAVETETKNQVDGPENTEEDAKVDASESSASVVVTEPSEPTEGLADADTNEAPDMEEDASIDTDTSIVTPDTEDPVADLEEFLNSILSE